MKRRLDRGDVAETDAMLTIRESKFGQPRLVPLQPSVLAALQRYTQPRDDVHHQPTTVSFFVSTRGDRMVYPTIHTMFRNLRGSAGIGAHAASPPRIHDYADLRVMPTSVRSSLWRTESRLMRSA